MKLLDIVVAGDCGLLYSSDEVSGSVLLDRPLYFSLSLTRFILCNEQSLELILSYPYQPSISFIVVFTYSYKIYIMIASKKKIISIRYMILYYVYSKLY